MPSLKIAPVTYHPSLLSLPVSPFSPVFPVSLPSRQNHATPPLPPLSTSTPPPPTPLRWFWQCHVCQRKYPLGTTRRCLEDGHFFCAGVTVARKRRRGGSGKARAVVKRHAPCASEFDYQGWSGWGKWRRAEGGRREGKDCWWCCDYPSECRWEPHGVVVAAEVAASTSEEEPLRRERVSSDELEDQRAVEQQLATTFDGILEGLGQLRDEQCEQASKVLKEGFWSGACKRRGTGSKLPLQLDTIVEDEESDHATGSSENIELMDLNVVIASSGIEKPEEAALRMPLTDELPSFGVSVVNFRTAFELDMAKLRKQD